MLALGSQVFSQGFLYLLDRSFSAKCTQIAAISRCLSECTAQGQGVEPAGLAVVDNKQMALPGEGELCLSFLLG